eukprot:scaffold11876_cov105-Isochrysis_galbana.AAC.3
MTRGAQRIMNETFDFLRLPRVDVGSKSRFCVRGKAGVMDVLHRRACARDSRACLMYLYNPLRQLWGESNSSRNLEGSCAPAPR